METILNTSSSRLARRSSRGLIGGAVKQLRYIVPTLLAGLALSSCLGGSNNDVAYVRAVNLVTDSPDLELTIDSSADVASFSYGNMTPLVGVHPGSHAIQVAGITASNFITQPQTTYEAFGTPLTQTFVAASGYTVVAYGTVADPKYLVTTDTNLESTVPGYEVIY